MILQVLDNEDITEYCRTIKEEWNTVYQLVPLHVHRHNAAERAIKTFRDHFLSIISGVDALFLNYLWDKLLPHADINLNLLQQSTLSPAMSAWEQFNGLFNYNATEIGPVGCWVLIHNKPN